MKSKNGKTYLKEELKPAPAGFPSWVRTQRIARRLTQKQFGARVGITHQHVAAIETGTKPSAGLIRDIKAYLGDENSPPKRARKAPKPAQNKVSAEDMLNALALLDGEGEGVREALRLLLERGL
jgi:transcriptional regulator with XRE-family HTH domain